MALGTWAWGCGWTLYLFVAVVVAAELGLVFDQTRAPRLLARWRDLDRLVVVATRDARGTCTSHTHTLRIELGTV